MVYLNLDHFTGWFHILSRYSGALATELLYFHENLTSAVSVLLVFVLLESLSGPLKHRYFSKIFGTLSPLTPTRGSAPGHRWGLRPQTPAVRWPSARRATHTLLASPASEPCRPPQVSYRNYGHELVQNQC